MCGIAGFIDFNVPEHRAGEILRKQLGRILHRGPDAQGLWFKNGIGLGHNRLSIIDLSEEANQPMIDAETGNVIVFNGEIYNYQEIRAELALKGVRFKTQSDTEVILKSYALKGHACVEDFVGMWAMAIWDPSKQELFCSRDRFGIKPFYYSRSGPGFYFGSEYKVFFDLDFFQRSVNLDQVSRGLQLGWMEYRDQTYYSRLHSLPAAHNLVLKNGQIEVSQYWDLAAHADTGLSLEDSAERFRELFFDSIRLHMRSDVEIGGCLSGGIDSSAIASAIGTAYSTKEFKTFTVYYDGEGEVDERPWAKHVLSKFSNLQPTFYKPQESELVDAFERCLYHADVPIAGSSPVSQFFVMRAASERNIKVLLDGQGSDEFLGGYMHSFYRLIGGSFAKFRFAQGLSEWRHHMIDQNFGSSKGRDILLKSILAGFSSENKLYRLEYDRYYPRLLSGVRSDVYLKKLFGYSRLQEFLYHLTFTTSLPSLLLYEDRNSMAFSIESRVPFLDHRLVEFAFSLPDRHLIQGGQTKRLLRHAMRGVIPEEIFNRKDKKGFVTPGEVKWLRGPLKYLLDQPFFKDFPWDVAKIEPVIKDFKNGSNRHATLVWRLLVLNYWLRKSL